MRSNLCKFPEASRDDHVHPYFDLTSDSSNESAPPHPSTSYRAVI
uniref:Uncharacterized protein n=1 Tax=Cyanothece sp. (strain PCC 7425 / ATCC 29141) TaxID=395961 RepID=B8HZL7_CYAP4